MSIIWSSTQCSPSDGESVQGLWERCLHMKQGFVHSYLPFHHFRSKVHHCRLPNCCQKVCGIGPPFSMHAIYEEIIAQCRGGWCGLEQSMA